MSNTSDASEEWMKKSTLGRGTFGHVTLWEHKVSISFYSIAIHGNIHETCFFMIAAKYGSAIISWENMPWLNPMERQSQPIITLVIWTWDMCRSVELFIAILQ